MILCETKVDYEGICVLERAKNCTLFMAQGSHLFGGGGEGKEGEMC